MVRKKKLIALVSVCMAILTVAFCGCDDLGAYGDTEEYYGSFGDIVLISGALGKAEEYSVEDYFYNKESREKFLVGEDGVYSGVEHSDYIYMAIPFEGSIDMDTIALYMKSSSEVKVYIDVFVINKMPTDWEAFENNDLVQEPAGGDPVGGSTANPENNEEPYDVSAPKTRIGEIVVHLKEEKWGSFVMDNFKVGDEAQGSIQIQNSIPIQSGQCILLQIRNNSGIRDLGQNKQSFVDPTTGLPLQEAEITMTNLLVRALEVTAGDNAQGGE